MNFSSANCGWKTVSPPEMTLAKASGLKLEFLENEMNCP